MQKYSRKWYFAEFEYVVPCAFLVERVEAGRVSIIMENYRVTHFGSGNFPSYNYVFFAINNLINFYFY